jgi:uncharacterized protein YndB with AHSA1/START domain
LNPYKKILYSLGAGLAAVLVTLYSIGGQPAEYRAFLATRQPPEKVFPYLIEPDKVKLWIGGLVESKVLTDGPPRPGSKSQDIVEDHGERIVFDSEILELVPNRFLSVRLSNETMDAVSQFKMKPDGLEHIQQVKCKGWMRMISLFLRAPIEAKLNEDFAKLKNLIEK